MNNSHSISPWSFFPKDKNEPKTQEIPCWSCGKIVIVSNPFYGCVYCRDCMTPKVYTLEGVGKVIKPL